MSLVAALRVELLKSRRSRVPWLVGAGLSAAPLVAGLFMVVLADPDAARRLGLLGTKAELAAARADWPTMLSMLAQAIAIGGGVLLAFLTSWVYGREYSDRTVRLLLAIPTPRPAIVSAKALVITIWGAAIIAWVIALGFLVGAALGLPGWSDAAAAEALWRMAATGILIIALQPVTALFASIGRGYLAGLAWTVLTVAAAQVLAVLGWGAVFPWAVPALVSGAGGAAAAADITLASVLLVLGTGVVGLVALIAWWTRADQLT
jgi:ABC-2 type transport system permease protein